MREFQFSDFNSIPRLLAGRRLLWRSQYFRPDEQRALQWKLLSRMLDHCFAHVPFYREYGRKNGLRRSDIRSLADLSLLPIISKENLVGDGESFKADRFGNYGPRLERTSGTTGTPLCMYWDLESNVMELLCHWRQYSWFRYRIGTPFMDIRNYQPNFKGPWKWNWKCRGLETSICCWDALKIRECAALLKKFRIRLWRGHPMAIFELCRRFEEAGIRDIKPRCIITVGEPLLSHEREYIEGWAEIPVGDSYGLIEHTALISQCPAGGYHIAVEYGIVEILDENWKPAAPGEEGRIVSTGLHNRAFPLLRYDTGDYAVPSERSCACGRTLPLVEKLTGRMDDRILGTNGRRISSLARCFHFSQNIRFSQIVQKQAGSLDVYIVPAPGFEVDINRQIIDRLLRELGEDMSIRVHTVDALPFQTGKKFKFVVNQMEGGHP